MRILALPPRVVRLSHRDPVRGDGSAPGRRRRHGHRFRHATRIPIPIPTAIRTPIPTATPTPTRTPTPTWVGPALCAPRGRRCRRGAPFPAITAGVDRDRRLRRRRRHRPGDGRTRPRHRGQGGDAGVVHIAQGPLGLDTDLQTQAWATIVGENGQGRARHHAHGDSRISTATASTSWCSGAVRSTSKAGASRGLPVRRASGGTLALGDASHVYEGQSDDAGRRRGAGVRRLRRRRRARPPVGAPYEGAGAVYGVSGEDTDEPDLDDALLRIDSDASLVRASVAGLGDLDGDGVDDFAIGSGHDRHLPRTDLRRFTAADADATSTATERRARAVPGCDRRRGRRRRRRPRTTSSSARPSTRPTRWTRAPRTSSTGALHGRRALRSGGCRVDDASERDDQEVGAQVASAGDIDGDTYSDVLVGAPGSQRRLLLPRAARSAPPASTTRRRPSRRQVDARGGRRSRLQRTSTATISLDAIIGAPFASGGEGAVYVVLGSGPLIRELVRWEPIAVGREAPFLSLTADDGTWVRLPDFRGKQAVVLLFFRSLDDQQTIRWLTAFERRREPLAKQDALVFGVSTHKTERLRAFRAEIGLGYPAPLRSDGPRRAGVPLLGSRAAGHQAIASSSRRTGGSP